MNRYAPELALITGGLLGGVFGGFVLVVLGEFYSAAVVCALFAYPFAAYAIHTDEDPTTVLSPRLVTIFAGVIAVGVLGDVLRLFGPTLDAFFVGLLLALGIFLPVAAYATQYGKPPTWLDPRVVEAVCSLLAVGFLVGSVSTGAISGAVNALVVFVAGAVFAQSTGASTTDSTSRRLTPIAGLVVAAGLLAVGVATGGPLDRWMAAALAAAFGPVIATAVTTTRQN